MRKNTRVIFALLIAVSATSPSAKAAPGSKEAAAELARQFLPLVTSGGSNQFEVTSVIPQDGNMFVNVGTPVGKDRNSCSVKLSRHDTANKYGWVVETYACGLISPAK